MLIGPELRHLCRAAFVLSHVYVDCVLRVAVAKAWSEGGAEMTNPNRAQQLHLLGSLVSARCVAHLRAGSDHARVLDLGVGSGLAARAVLEHIPPDSSIVGVDESEAMLELLRQNASPRERLAALPIGFDNLERSRSALGLVETATAAARPFACAMAVQSLHEVDNFTKRRALSFARSALMPGRGTLYILDRFNFDPDSELHDEYAAMWQALQSSPISGWEWYEYQDYMRAKLDDAWASPQQCVRLCNETGYDAEVLYLAFNRFLVAARPRPDADDERERLEEFEAWRRERLERLGAPSASPTKGRIL